MLSVPVPRVAVPFLNVTVPPGDPAPEVTVAVKVTAVPCVEGFLDEATEAELLALLTFWVSTGDVLALKKPVFGYTAVRESVPAGRFAIVSVAFPPLRGTVPSVALPFLKVTDPPGVPPPDVTLAVNVTAVP